MARLSELSWAQRREFARLALRWAVLGSTARTWAIAECSPPRTGQSDIAAFLETGRVEVDRVAGRLVELGVRLEGTEALDFGCGPGRMSQALATRYQSVRGLDISQEMVDLARSLLPAGVGCSFDRLVTPDLARIPSNSFDLVFCVYLLQHLPAWLVRRYLVEFARVLRPGGMVVLQFHSSPVGVPLRWVPSSVGSLVVNPLRRVHRQIVGRSASWDDFWMRPGTLAEMVIGSGIATLSLDRAPRPEGRMESHWLYGRKQETSGPDEPTPAGATRP